MINTQELIAISKQAGKAIMEIYNNAEFSKVVNFKADDSPLTLADQASHDVIMEALSNLTPDIPIISEEGVDVPFDTRKHYTKYWLIDPLDGTKEFINRNGEFTVNIALIENNKPTQGFIYVPVTAVMYYTEDNTCYKESHEKIEILKVNNSSLDRVAVRSKSHASPEEEVVLNKYGVTDSISVGSSLKFCMVGEGKADIYYRHGPTMEWDTAAGQAVLQAAGGRIYKGNQETDTFTYNKGSLLNGGFLCLGF
jgi:3'(2'), 5'-bisphosphate nucleotidase